MYNLRELLLQKGVPFRRSPRPTGIYVNCPFCTDRGESEDTKFRLGVNCLTGWGRCFNCGWFSSAKTAVLLLRKWRFAETAIYDFVTEEESVEQPQLPEDFQPLTEVVNELDAQAQKYVLDRGVTLRQVQRHRVGVSFVGRYAYRIVFPIYYRKAFLGLVARDFTGQQQPKYLFNRGVKALYNMRPGAERVILSEGVFKALRIERAIKGWRSVALLGHDLSEAQIEFLTGVKEVVVWPDPDKPGRRGAANVCDKLQSKGVQVSVLPEVTLPADEATLPELRAEFGQARKYNTATVALLFSSLHSGRSHV